MWATSVATAGFSIPTLPPLSEEDASNYAVRFFLVGLYIQYERMYFYNWGGRSIPLVLQPAGGPPTRAAHTSRNCSAGWRMPRIRSCGHGTDENPSANVWQCRFTMSDGGGAPDEAAIWWTDRGTATIKVEGGAYRMERLDSHTENIAGGDDVRITERPILSATVEHTDTALG